MAIASLRRREVGQNMTRVEELISRQQCKGRERGIARPY